MIVGVIFEDVEVMVKYVGEGVKIKVVGGILLLEDVEKFIVLGVLCLGISCIIKIVKN